MLSPKLKSTILIFCILIAAIGYQFSLSAPSLKEYLRSPNATWQGEPLLTTADGYLFLRYAAEYMAGTFTKTDQLRPHTPTTTLPPLSLCAAELSSQLNVPLERVAFYLPPFLAALMVFVCIGLGQAFNSLSLGLTTFVFSAMSPAWFRRVTPGAFDTDSLNQLFFWTGLVSGYFFVTRRGIARIIPGLGLLLCTYLLSWWWPQAGIYFGILLIGLTLVGYAISIRLSLNSIAIICATGLITLSAIFLFYHQMPPAFVHIIDSLKQHLALTLGLGDALFVPIGKTIGELTNTSILQGMSDIATNIVLFLIMLAGMIHLIKKAPLPSLFFIFPSIVFYLISFKSGNRFLMFCAPTFGLCMAWFILRSLDKLARLGELHYAPFFSAFFAGLLIILGIIWCWNQELTPTSDRDAAFLATECKKRTPEKVQLWNWWGPGYFIEYFAQRPTIIDGGSQTSESAFIVARPLAAKDPLLARNWIKFFAAHPNGLHALGQTMSKAEAIAFLETVFANPITLKAEIQKRNLSQKKDWNSYLFPQKSVYLFLKREMLTHGTWLPIGMWKTSDPTQIETTAFIYNAAAIDRKKGTIKVSRRPEQQYSKLYFITPNALSHDPVRQIGPVVILIQGAPMVFVIPQKYFDVLTYRLLFVTPNGVPGFVPVAYHPFIGGIWKIQ